jgi:hypothetical protein
MPFDRAASDGNESRCVHCELLIEPGASVFVDFGNDDAKVSQFTGHYHALCSKPYAAMARVIRMLATPWPH